MKRISMTSMRIPGILLCLLLPSLCLCGAEVGKTSAAMRKVNEAAVLIQEHRFDEALRTRIDPLIEEFQNRYGKEKRRIYATNSSTETLFYLVQSAADKQDAIAVDGAYALAYFIKGYVLIDQNDTKGAMPFLEKACALSPSNPQFLNELANVFQNRKAWPQALDLYEKALKDAKLFEPAGSTNFERRALRGKGYVLVELKRFKESEDCYLECLRLDPNDDFARRELEYVRQTAKAATR